MTIWKRKNKNAINSRNRIIAFILVVTNINMND